MVGLWFAQKWSPKSSATPNASVSIKHFLVIQSISFGIAYSSFVAWLLGICIMLWNDARDAKCKTLCGLISQPQNYYNIHLIARCNDANNKLAFSSQFWMCGAEKPLETRTINFDSSFVVVVETFLLLWIKLRKIIAWQNGFFVSAETWQRLHTITAKRMCGNSI